MYIPPPKTPKLPHIHNNNSNATISFYNTFAKSLIKVSKDKKHRTNANMEFESLYTPSRNEIKTEISKWFNLLDTVTKFTVCTVHNKLIIEIINQLIMLDFSENSVTFKPTQHNKNFYNEDNYKHNSYDSDDETITQEQFEMINKETPSLNDYMYFFKKCKTDTSIDSSEQKEKKDLEREFILQLSYISIIESNDAISLYPDFLKKNLFEFMDKLIGDKFLTSWIMPERDEQLYYSYPLPSWVKKESSFTAAQIIAAYIEQMILLNYQYYYYTTKIYDLPYHKKITDLFEKNRSLEEFLEKECKVDKIKYFEGINYESIRDEITKEDSIQRKMRCIKELKMKMSLTYPKRCNLDDEVIKKIKTELRRRFMIKIEQFVYKLAFPNGEDVLMFVDCVYKKTYDMLYERLSSQSAKEIIEDLDKGNVIGNSSSNGNSNGNKSKKKHKKKKKKNSNATIVTGSNSSLNKNEKGSGNNVDDFDNLLIEDNKEMDNGFNNSNLLNDNCGNEDGKKILSVMVGNYYTENDNKDICKDVVLEVNNEEDYADGNEEETQPLLKREENEIKDINYNYINDNNNENEINKKEEFTQEIQHLLDEYKEKSSTLPIEDNKDNKDTIMNETNTSSPPTQQSIPSPQSPPHKKKKKNNFYLYPVASKKKKQTPPKPTSLPKTSPVTNTTPPSFPSTSPQEIQSNLKTTSVPSSSSIPPTSSFLPNPLSIPSKNLPFISFASTPPPSATFLPQKPPSFPFFNFYSTQTYFNTYYIFKNLSCSTPSKMFFYNLSNEIFKYSKNVLNNIISLNKWRREKLNYIKTVLSECLSEKYDIDIQLYGSAESELQIENSDYDILVMFSTKNDEFQDKGALINEIHEYFVKKNKKNSFYEEILPLPLAKVPIIKIKCDISEMIDKQSFDFIQLTCGGYVDMKDEINKVKFDISFSTKKNKKKIFPLQAVDYVKNCMLQYPNMKNIMLVMKRFMKNRKMNNSFRGGLSSYSLFLLLYSYFRTKPGNNEQFSIGRELYHFLDWYSSFDFQKFAVDPSNEGYSFIPNKNSEDNKSVVIIDPFSKVNVASSSYKIDEIKKVFLEGVNCLKCTAIKGEGVYCEGTLMILKELFGVKKCENII